MGDHDLASMGLLLHSLQHRAWGVDPSELMREERSFRLSLFSIKEEPRIECCVGFSELACSPAEV